MGDTQAARLGEAMEHVPYGGYPDSMGGAGVARGATSARGSSTTGLLHPVRWSAKVVHAKRSSARHRCVLEAAFCRGEARA
jgi:hypothetical protein